MAKPSDFVQREKLSLLFLALSWLLTAWYWNRLPGRIPTHWGISGQPDQWMNMPWGGLFPALLTTVSYLLLVCIPWLDPRWQRLTEEAYTLIKQALMAFFAFTTFMVLSTSIQTIPQLAVSRLLIGIGLLFILVGNYLPKLRSNFFVGIRTPWTLSSEEVWNQTHRVGGKIMVGMGFLVFFAAFLPLTWAFAAVTAAGVFLGLWSLGYSLWLFKRLKEANDAGH